MRTVLHYKTHFLNPSETFIHRFIANHQSYRPAALCYNKKSFSGNLDIYEVPKTGSAGWMNRLAFLLNRTLPYYRQTIEELRPDLIHAHFGYDGYKLLSLSESLNIPLLISFYGSDVSRLPGEAGWKKRYRKMARSTARFVAASEFMKRQLIGLGFPESRIEVVRFGFDTREIPFHPGYRPDKPVMMVGRLVEKKGFRYALKALHLLKQSGIEAEAHIFGDGPLRQKLALLSTELGIDQQIHFRGFQPVDKILDELPRHSLLLAPSVRADDGDMEGLPNTILEAMAAGTPVLTTRQAAIPEAVMHTKSGFLTDERDPRQLAGIMERFYSGDYPIMEICKNARTVIEQEYQLEKNVRQLEALYDQMTKGGPGRNQ